MKIICLRLKSCDSASFYNFFYFRISRRLKRRKRTNLPRSRKHWKRSKRWSPKLSKNHYRGRSWRRRIHRTFALLLQSLQRPLSSKIDQSLRRCVQNNFRVFREAYFRVFNSPSRRKEMTSVVLRDPKKANASELVMRNVVEWIVRMFAAVTIQEDQETTRFATRIINRSSLATCHTRYRRTT